MEIFSVKNLSFTYPQMQEKALDNVNFTVKRGEFLCYLRSVRLRKNNPAKTFKAAGSSSRYKNGRNIFLFRKY